MNARTIFVTGTDTEVGKTHICCALLRQLRAAGHTACGYKPVASGCEQTPQGLRNDDALALQRAAAGKLTYAQINPYAFAPAIAPHLAAKAAALRIKTTVLDEAHARLVQAHDIVVIEGAGGWLVPLNDDISFAGWVAQHDWPVLLVVGMRLGCINHALLSAESIQRRTRLLGWVANVLPPEMPELHGNIESLKQRMPAPLLGVMPAGADAPLDLSLLLSRSRELPETPDAEAP
jgi:dethiobiotin synthetase